MTSLPCISTAELAAAGRALYGERWQTPLARDLGISDRTLRRWLTERFPIPTQVRERLRALLSKRLETIGGMIAFDLAPGEKSICYSYTGSCFRYDDAGKLTDLTPGLASPRELPLIRLGAEEKLRRYQEDTSAGAGPDNSAMLHGFMRGTVVIPLDADLTEPVINEVFAADEGELHR